MSHFFAYLARMRFIQRWGLMRNTTTENIQEHSLQVAMIAHALAVLRNRRHGGRLDAARTALLGLYHDASEVITGDLATPIKNFNPQIKGAFREIEGVARERLCSMLPEDLRGDYRPLLQPEADDREHWLLVRAADKICAHLKCIEELQAGNQGFEKAEKTLRAVVEQIGLPEAADFVRVFVPSFSLTLDELN